MGRSPHVFFLPSAGTRLSPGVERAEKLALDQHTARNGPSRSCVLVAEERKQAHSRQEHECDSATGPVPSYQPALTSDLTGSRGFLCGERGSSNCMRLRDGPKRLRLRRGCSLRTAGHAALPGVSIPAGGRPAVSCAGSRFRGRACAGRVAGTEARDRRSAPPAARAGR
jgi:hypothetical protein